MLSYKKGENMNCKIEWIEIPGGEFLCSNDIYGGDSKALQLTFTIGKYSVTNAQYKLSSF